MKEFKLKTRRLDRAMYPTDPFFYKNEYINEENLSHIIDVIFEGKILISKQELLNQLNKAILEVGHVFPDRYSRAPGKTDEFALLSSILNNSIKLSQDLLTLLTQYGEQTWQYLEIQDQATDERLETQSALWDILKTVRTLMASIPDALDNIQNSSGKPKGNHTRKAMPELIKKLIKIYENATGVCAKDNFHTDQSSGSLYYKGNFYDFTCCIIQLVNSKFDQFLKKAENESNPFKFCLPSHSPFHIPLNQESTALGGQIEIAIAQLFIQDKKE